MRPSVTGNFHIIVRNRQTRELWPKGTNLLGKAARRLASSELLEDAERHAPRRDGVDGVHRRQSLQLEGRGVCRDVVGDDGAHLQGLGLQPVRRDGHAE